MSDPLDGARGPTKGGQDKYLTNSFSSRLRGDVRINWLQPPYSAVSCSQIIEEMLCIALERCSILAAASSYEF